MGGMMRAVRFDRGRVVDSEDGGRPSTQAHGSTDIHRVCDGVYLHRDDLVEWLRGQAYMDVLPMDADEDAAIGMNDLADFLKGAGLL